VPKFVTSTDFYGKDYTVNTNELVWRPAAYAVVLHEGKVLLTKQRGYLFLPGGGVNLGESPEDAVIREVREETGIIVANPRLIDLTSSYYTWEEKVPNTYTHNQSLRLYYLCDYKGGELSTDGAEPYEMEHGEMPEWLPPDRLDTIKAGGTGDWRPMVFKALKLK
jgi:8-oxo-dGTP diphosphatase